MKKFAHPPMNVIAFSPTTSVETMIKSYANAEPREDFNEEELNAFLLHRKVCRKVLDFQATHPEMPLYAILLVGVTTGAFKRSDFMRGYRSFDYERAEFVLDMGKWYNGYLGLTKKPSDTAYRLITRFYKTTSKSKDEFRYRVKKAYELDGKRGHYPSLCQSIGCL